MAPALVLAHTAQGGLSDGRDLPRDHGSRADRGCGSAACTENPVRRSGRELHGKRTLRPATWDLPEPAGAEGEGSGAAACGTSDPAWHGSDTGTGTDAYPHAIANPGGHACSRHPLDGTDLDAQSARASGAAGSWCADPS